MSNRFIKYGRLPDKTGGLIVTPGYLRAFVIPVFQARGLKAKRDAQG
jgi:hypothetical protein